MYTPTIDDEMMRLRYESCLADVENAPEVWGDSPRSVRENMRRLEAALAEVREDAAMFGPEAFEYITGAPLELCAVGTWISDDADEPIPFYSVAVVPGERPRIVHGASTIPLASDVECALSYLRSIGYAADHVRHDGVTESGELRLLEVS